ncbi:MAG: type II toxin-antitoxin system RelE/ParE family toxin [Prevotella sp.]|nr:type II toxin-antitoxin system RelE/ParE family toxin [Prevotella sp.]
MAQIRWTKKAEGIFFDRVLHAYHEFGATTAKRWQEERKRIEHQLEEFPESYSPEKLLAERRFLYRSCHMMRRFKLIHYYSVSSDTVWVIDIWDSKMSPDNLQNRIG